MENETPLYQVIGKEKGEKSALWRLTAGARGAALGAAEKRPGTALYPLRLCDCWFEQRLETFQNKQA